jgi:hypothetical protein
MQFTTTQDFPARLDQLWAVFGHPEYPRQKYLALGATAVRLHRFEATAQSIKVDLERVVPLVKSRLPKWAHKLIGSEQRLRHRTAWRRIGATQITAELDIAPVGLPVRAHGAGMLIELASGTSRMALTWRVDSSLPLMRSKVERLFADQVRYALKDDHRFTVHYLQGVSLKRPRMSSSGSEGAR